MLGRLNKSIRRIHFYFLNNQTSSAPTSQPSRTQCPSAVTVIDLIQESTSHNTATSTTVSTEGVITEHNSGDSQARRFGRKQTVAFVKHRHTLSPTLIQAQMVRKVVRAEKRDGGVVDLKVRRQHINITAPDSPVQSGLLSFMNSITRTSTTVNGEEIIL